MREKVNLPLRRLHHLDIQECSLLATESKIQCVRQQYNNTVNAVRLFSKARFRFFFLLGQKSLTHNFLH